MSAASCFSKTTRRCWTTLFSGSAAISFAPMARQMVSIYYCLENGRLIQFSCARKEKEGACDKEATASSRLLQHRHVFKTPAEHGLASAAEPFIQDRCVHATE